MHKYKWLHNNTNTHIHTEAWHWKVYTMEWRWWISYQFVFLGYCIPCEFLPLLPGRKVFFPVKPISSHEKGIKPFFLERTHTHTHTHTPYQLVKVRHFFNCPELLLIPCLDHGFDLWILWLNNESVIYINTFMESCIYWCVN